MFVGGHTDPCEPALAIESETAARPSPRRAGLIRGRPARFVELCSAGRRHLRRRISDPAFPLPIAITG
ncbi:MAG: hypothetical protein JXA74_09315, partial [Anaerolineae bacterium]|nr:hypothetical protein [Anaerolineae bacterium]